MDSIYAAANNASKAVWGDSNTDSNRPQNTQNTQSRTGGPSAVSDTHATGNNQFRGTTTDNDSNPFRHATDSTSYSSGNVLGGSGSQHTAGSGLDHKIELNKPTLSNLESGQTSFGQQPGSGIGGFSGLGKQMPGTYDQPSKDFSKPETAGTYGLDTPTFGSTGIKPTTTTTSTFEKNPVGDFNKDGFRHETSDIDHLPKTSTHTNFGSDNRPTISDITGLTTGVHSGAPSGARSAANSGLRSAHYSGANSGESKPFRSTFSEGPLGSSSGISDFDKLDKANTADRFSTGHTGTGAHNKPSTRAYGADEHMTDPTHFDKPDTHSFNDHSGVSKGLAAGGLASGVGAGEHHRQSTNHGAGGIGGVSSDQNRPTDTSSFNKSAPSYNDCSTDTSNTPIIHQKNRDDTHHEHTPHHQSGAAPQGSNIKPLTDTNDRSTGAFSSDKPSSSNVPNAGAHNTSTSGLETANSAPKSLVGIGSGPGATAEPSVNADPNSAQKPTEKQQGADKPLVAPSSGSSGQPPAHKPLDSKTDKGHSEGTGEKYEKSTGVAAEGGDFDASRPGAGREAERLLDEKGIHHGRDQKSGQTNQDIAAAAAHPKLLPHKKETAKTSEHGTAEHGKTTEHGKTAPAGKTADPSPAESEHKGLGEKIKEKLHLGHH